MYVFRLLWKVVALKRLNVDQALIPNTVCQDGIGVHQSATYAEGTI